MELRALVLVVVSVGALAVPARAAHPNIMCVDLGDDVRYATGNDDMIELVSATIGTNDADHEAPLEEGCVVMEGDFGGTQIDFEITGVEDPDSSDTPETPDLSCTIPNGANRCQVEPPSSWGGAQTIRSWIDFDRSDLMVEADRAEGSDESNDPGDQGEPDGTDVQDWMWTHGDPPPPPCGADNVCWQRITIDYRRWRGTFFGILFRESDSCDAAHVSVWKARPGPDRLIADTRSRGGRWSVATRRRASGRYYARAGRAQVHVPNSEPPFAYECLPDRSRTIEV